MSEAKKEKVQMDPKYILKLAGVLMLISAIVAGLLGLVNGVTWEKIAEIQAQKLQASLQAVRHKGRQQPVIQLQGRAVRERHRAQFRAAGRVEAEMDFFLPRHGESGLFRSTAVECGGSFCNFFFLALGIDGNLYFVRAVQGKRVVTGSQRHRTE